ncbi:MAG: dockerin type I repeat-containing protein [Prevotella sp.]|nr:dockerin type I repeat-containing protein [Prevotella sp.]
MNRLRYLGLSLLALLCWLTATAQDPSVTKCEYWFDQQYDSHTTADVSEGTWTKDFDISALNYGLHSIAFRVLTVDGTKSLYGPVVVKNFMKLETTPTGTNTLKTYEYWIDQKFDKRKNGTIDASGIVNFDEDLSALDYGLHNVTIRVIDATGKVSSALVKNFMKLETTPTGDNSLKTYEYWIDQEFDKRKSGTVDASGIVNFDEDLSALDYGLHNVTIRVIDATGKVSSALVKNFMKLETTPTGDNSLKTYEYWIDQEFDERKSGTIDESGIINFDEDISALDYGLHNVTIRVIDATGKVSSALTKNFMKVEQMDGDNALTTYEYWIDNAFDERESAAVPDGGIVNLNIDISALKQGLHTFNYRTADKAEKVSAVVTKNFFVKKVEGEGKIIGVDYWFNDGPRTRIAIDPAQASIDKNDIVISLDGVQPRSISEDYSFDATTKTVKTTETITFGIQVFNDAEVGTEAVVETLEDYLFNVDINAVALTDGISDTKAAPQGGQVQGFSFDGAVGDSLHWELTGSDAKIDFFDANGNRLTPESKTIDEKDVLIIKMPTTTVYALTYGATEAGEMTVKVSIKVAYIQGDVNSDGVVNVTDIVATVNYIMDKPAPNFNKDAADVNGDGVINVTDIVMMVNIIMTGSGPSSSRRAASTGGLILHGKDVLLRDAGDYTAVQFDINLRDGQSVNDVVQCCSSDHQLTWKMVDAVTCRVVVYSMTNAAFHTNGDALMNIIMNGGVEDATISNEVLIRAEGTTGIDSYQQVKSYDVYDLRGNKVRQNATSLDGLPDGVYIVNGKKVLHRRKK